MLHLRCHGGRQSLDPNADVNLKSLYCLRAFNLFTLSVALAVCLLLCSFCIIDYFDTFVMDLMHNVDINNFLGSSDHKFCSFLVLCFSYVMVLDCWPCIFRFGLLNPVILFLRSLWVCSFQLCTFLWCFLEWHFQASLVSYIWMMFLVRVCSYLFTMLFHVPSSPCWFISQSLCQAHMT